MRFSSDSVAVRRSAQEGAQAGVEAGADGRAHRAGGRDGRMGGETGSSTTGRTAQAAVASIVKDWAHVHATGAATGAVIIEGPLAGACSAGGTARARMPHSKYSAARRVSVESWCAAVQKRTAQNTQKKIPCTDSTEK